MDRPIKFCKKKKKKFPPSEIITPSKSLDPKLSEYVYISLFKNSVLFFPILVFV